MLQEVFNEAFLHKIHKYSPMTMCAQNSYKICSYTGVFLTGFATAAGTQPSHRIRFYSLDCSRPRDGLEAELQPRDYHSAYSPSL